MKDLATTDPVPRNTAATKIGNGVISLPFHRNSIVTNLHLYLIRLWWQFFQIFVYSDVVYG